MLVGTIVHLHENPFHNGVDGKLQGRDFDPGAYGSLNDVNS